MSVVKFDSKTIEMFSIRVIEKSFDKSYGYYEWHDKNDDFDFTIQNDIIALEVAVVMPKNIEKLIEYKKAIEYGKTPNVNRLVGADVNNEGKLVSCHGSTIPEIQR